ncbi:MAG: hypothetical protein HY682_00960 [Chloroflexi bacterium]|nr:hypothetical protein [Chloroflexota bacterium]
MLKRITPRVGPFDGAGSLSRFRVLILVLALVALFAVVACRRAAPEASPTPGVPGEATPAGSPAPLPTDTPAAVVSPAASPAPAETPTAAATPVETPTAAATPVPVESPTPAASPTPAETPTAPATPAPVETPTPAASPTPAETPTPAATPTPVGRTFEVVLEQWSADGQEGTATFTESDTVTMVTVEVTPVFEGGVEQATFIQSGPCSNIGPAELSLNAPSGGTSETEVAMSFDDLTTMEGWVAVLKLDGDVWVMTACSSILGEEAVTVPPTPAGTPSPPATPTPEATPTPVPVATPAPVATTTVVTLNAVGGSGQSGTATFEPAGDKTVVRISITPGPAGVSQPVHFHFGSCASLGGVDSTYPLNFIVDGKSDTTVNASISTLFSLGRALNVHQSETNMSVNVACGDVVAPGG